MDWQNRPGVSSLHHITESLNKDRKTQSSVLAITPSLATVTEALLPAPVRPSSFSHPTAPFKYHTALTAELLQNIPRGTKSTSLFRFSSERPLCWKLSSNLCSQTCQPRSEWRIKITFRKLFHHWPWTPFQVLCCLLGWKIANAFTNIHRSSSGADLHVAGSVF